MAFTISDKRSTEILIEYKALMVKPDLKEHEFERLEYLKDWITEEDLLKIS